MNKIISTKMKNGYDLVEPYVIYHYYCFGHLISVSKTYCYTKNIIYIYFFLNNS